MSTLPGVPPKNDPQCLTVDVVSGSDIAEDVRPDDPPAADPPAGDPDGEDPDDAEQPAAKSTAATTHSPARINGSSGRATGDDPCTSRTPGH
jgi:hypothetical protein